MEQVKAGDVCIDEAIGKLRPLPFEGLGFGVSALATGAGFSSGVSTGLGLSASFLGLLRVAGFSSAFGALASFFNGLSMRGTSFFTNAGSAKIIREQKQTAQSQ